MATSWGQCLSGVNACVGDCPGLSLTEKLHLKKIITSAGGTVTYLVHPKTTHFVTCVEELRSSSQKVRTACKYGVRLVNPTWLLRSEAEGSRQDETPYLLSLDQDQQPKPINPAQDDNDSGQPVVVADDLSANEAGNSTMGSKALVGRRGNWLSPAVSSVLSSPSALSSSLSTSASTTTSSTTAFGDFAITLQSEVTPLFPELGTVPVSATSSLLNSIGINGDEDDEFVLMAMEKRIVRNLRLALEVAGLLVPPTSAFWGDGPSLQQQLQNRSMAPRKEKWAIKLEEKQKALKAASELKKSEKEHREIYRSKAIRRTRGYADEQLMKSFKADARALEQYRREQKRSEKLARLREGWLAEIARRKKREEEKEEEKLKRRMAWEEKQREKQRRREEYMRKKAEWLAKQSERDQKQREWEAQLKKWEEQKRAELYKKFFVGNLKWADITVEEMGSENAVQFARQKRWEQLREVFFSFGPISHVKEHWDRGCVFVVYTEREHAEKAMEVLSSWNERVKRTEAIRKKLLEGGQPLIYTPLPNFYLRWPKKEPHPKPEEEKKLREDVEQKKLALQQKKDAEAQEVADGWSKNPTTNKKKLREEAKAEEAALAAIAEAEAKANAKPDLRPKKVSDGKSKKKREKRKIKEAEKRQKAKSKGKRRNNQRNEHKAQRQKPEGEESASEVTASRSRGGPMRGRGGLTRGRGGPMRGRGGPMRGGPQEPRPVSTTTPDPTGPRPVRGRGGGRGMRGGFRGGRGSRGAVPRMGS